jgi:hypothetical protein
MNLTYPRRPAARLAVGAAVPIILLTAGATAVAATGDPTPTTPAGAVAAAQPGDPNAPLPPPDPATGTTTGTTTPDAAAVAAAVAADTAAGTQAADPAPGTPAAPSAPPATTPVGTAAPMAIKNATNANAAPPPPNPNCTLIVPADPLSAQGLATPYQLVSTDPNGPACSESTKEQSAFVQAAVLTPRGRLSLYNPLVVDAGTRPAAEPVKAFVPPNSVVGIWFGFNGDQLTLKSADGTDALGAGHCVNGNGGSIFGQFAYCNAPEFFTAANAAISAGRLRVPRLGTARDGMPCPTVRDFSVVDQDQSDNVNTHYLATADGRTAQPGTARQVGGSPTDLANGSDNRLLTEFVLPTLGCRSFTRPDQSNGAKLTASLPLQELQAAAHQRDPIALVPSNDPMTLDGDNPSPDKVNAFRAGVDQPKLAGAPDGDPTAYCAGIFTDPAGIQRVFRGEKLYARGKSPNPKGSTNLFTFLASRASETYKILGCGPLLGRTANPITLTQDAAGVVTAATFAGVTAGTPGPGQGNPGAGNPGAGNPGAGNPAGSGRRGPGGNSGRPARRPAAANPIPAPPAP